MSTWRTHTDYGGHPGAPPPRGYLPEVTTGRLTLIRIRNVVTTNIGSTDSGWSDWVTYSVGVDWLLPGYSTTAGSSFTKTECFIEVASGIGRPWKLIWRRKITNTITSAVTYGSDEEL